MRNAEMFQSTAGRLGQLVFPLDLDILNGLRYFYFSIADVFIAALMKQYKWNGVGPGMVARGIEASETCHPLQWPGPHFPSSCLRLHLGEVWGDWGGGNPALAVASVWGQLTNGWTSLFFVTLPFRQMNKTQKGMEAISYRFF